jgi:hypothetical protein
MTQRRGVGREFALSCDLRSPAGESPLWGGRRSRLPPWAHGRSLWTDGTAARCAPLLRGDAVRPQRTIKRKEEYLLLSIFNI